MTPSFSRPAPNAKPDLSTLFRHASTFIPTGIALLSNAEVTMMVSSLQCVSFRPPMLSVALAVGSKKGTTILSGGRFRARLLRHGEENSATDERILSGVGILDMECAIAEVFRAGDHHLVLAEVRSALASEGYPIVYWRRGFHAFQPRYKFLISPEAFHEFVAAWEAGSLPHSEWTHAAHVAIGASYAVRFRGTAFERIRAGIIRFNDAVGTVNSARSGYHETLTRFWSILLAEVAQTCSDPWDAACKAVEKFGEDRDLHCLYYSFDVLRNEEARQTWIPPDLDGQY